MAGIAKSSLFDDLFIVTSINNDRCLSGASKASAWVVVGEHLLDTMKTFPRHFVDTS